MDATTDVRRSVLNIVARAVSAEVYAAEMDIAAGLMDWKGLWKPRGTWTEGNEKHGLGMALHTWGGAAGGGKCTVRINPDGTVESFAGTQDLGTGTTTLVPIVAAEILGLEVKDIQGFVGSSAYPPAGGSGGSTSCGGVSLAVAAAVLLAYVPRLPSAEAANGLGLSNGSVRITSGTNRRLRLFAVTQIAASFVLLAGAGMLLTFDPSERKSVASRNGARVLYLLAPWPAPGHYRGGDAPRAAVQA